METEAAGLQERVQRALGDAYTLERELGGGGMARVFVAEDATLGRAVVVKVLRPELAEGLSAERFKREVRLAARLQHPHIVPLLAAGELPGGVLYYTMPLVAGETLRARVGREGALPVGEAVRLLRDVASALAYAHRHGVVHRDVKPENVLLSEGGALVADFGIAKAISAARADDGDDAARAATLTEIGTSLGTPAYIAPEQAAADAVDHRADLYALGCVAYELLTGRPPFDGRTAQQLLAAHAVELPEPVARRRSGTPPALAALVMRLLEKHPADRPQSADEVLRALDVPPGSGAGERAGERADAVRRTTGHGAMRRRWAGAWRAAALASVAALAGAALAMALAMGLTGGRAPVPGPVVASLEAPDGRHPVPGGQLALSPDGRRLAFVAADAEGRTTLWLRSLDSLAATPVSGTEGATFPFWSPDGRSLGFFAGGQLQTLDLLGGTHRRLCPVSRPGGATWTRRGVIVYAPDYLGVLHRVPAEGGPCVQLTRLRPGDFDHRRPSALPDGDHVVFSGYRANAAMVADVSSGAITEIRRPGRDAVFVAPDWLLFRDEDGGRLFAQRLDLRTLRSRGEPQVVLDRVGGASGFAVFTAASGTLVAVRAPTADAPLLWVDRRSAVVDSIPAASVRTSGASFTGFALSHDERRIAFAGRGLWVYDRDRRVATRVPAEATPGQGLLHPAWSPGDSLIAYGTSLAGALSLRVYDVRTGRSDSLVSIGRRVAAQPDWSPDGRRIAYRLSPGDGVPRDEIWIYSFAERRATRAWEIAGDAAAPRWSPDGRWLAYVSDETGAREVYVRPAAGAGVAVRASVAGGEEPRWRADGRELYYQTRDGAIHAVDVAPGAPGSGASLSPPRAVLVRPPFPALTNDYARSSRGFAVTRDGERFVAFGRGEPPVMTLMLDWPARLARR